MTRGSIREYTEAVRGRYLRASKKEKGKISDEFTEVVGCHRKAAIRLLHRTNQVRMNGKRGYPRQYGAPVADALMVAWETLVDIIYSHPGFHRLKVDSNLSIFQFG